jgi:hypothetical protein
MKTLLFSLMFAGLCHPQALNGIHAPVSRNVNIPADEASFNITVGAKADSTVKQVKEALQNAGALNPTVVAVGIGKSQSGAVTGPEAVYTAAFALPAASAAEVAKGLLDLSAHLPEPLTFLRLNVTYAASEARVEQERQTVLPQLRDEATKVAQALAAAAGVKLGRLRAANENPANGMYLNASRIGDFSAITGFISPFPPNIAYIIRLELVFEAIP